MSMKEKLKFNGKIISVELLHELASDDSIREINLGNSISGRSITGCSEELREFDQWELAYSDGNRIMVYV